jgi:uncharacterized protein (TIGR00299 family) protein
MRKVFLQPSSGISGDMLLGTLVDLGVDGRELERDLAALGISGFRLDVGRKATGGMDAAKVTPRFGKKAPRLGNLAQVNELLQASDLPGHVVKEAGMLFRRLAEAEASVHGGDAGSVHFHELGSPDTVIDVVGVLLAWKRLGIGEGFASAPNLGCGEVKTEHGTFSVPAPVTARLLEGWPVYADGEEGEKTTPTGALLLTHLCRPAAGIPPFVLERVGRGAGERDFTARPNVLQGLLGAGEAETVREPLVLVETNLDDLNPQVLGGLPARLLKEGALEAYLTPVVMKKGRPGHLLTALVPPAKEEGIGRLLMRETGTLGYRATAVDRTRLERKMEEVQVAGGTVRIKTARLDGKVVRFAPEYEDCRRIAEKSGRPVRDILEEASARRSGGGRGKEER